MGRIPIVFLGISRKNTHTHTHTHTQTHTLTHTHTHTHSVLCSAAFARAHTPVYPCCSSRQVLSKVFSQALRQSHELHSAMHHTCLTPRRTSNPSHTPRCTGETECLAVY